jgi:hypothetical protein
MLPSTTGLNLLLGFSVTNPVAQLNNCAKTGTNRPGHAMCPLHLPHHAALDHGLELAGNLPSLQLLPVHALEEGVALDGRSTIRTAAQPQRRVACEQRFEQG